MAVASFLLQVVPGSQAAVERRCSSLEGVTFHPTQSNEDMVLVAEMHSSELPGLEHTLKHTEGVLSLATAFLSIEDELGAAGSPEA